MAEINPDKRVTIGQSGRLASAVRRLLSGGARTTRCVAMVAVGLGPVAGSCLAQAFPPTIPLRSLLPGAGGDGSTGFVLNGGEAGSQSGRSSSGTGDVNGDGIDDLIIGASAARMSRGETYVVYGRSAGFSAKLELWSLSPGAGGDGSTGFVITGVRPGDEAGRWVSGLGDVNGDGIDDFLLGAPFASPDGSFEAGESYVVFGRPDNFPPSFALRTLFPGAGGDGSEGFVLKGIDAGDWSGRFLSGAGDVNGDGIDDLIIGARYATPNGRERAGESYVVFGRSGGFPPLTELASLLPAAGGDGSTGFVLEGVDAFDYSGRSVSGVGDVNDDGIDDLIVGADQADPGGRADAGECYVVFGRSDGFPPVLALESLLPSGGGDGSAGFVLEGVDASDGSGHSVSGAGDVNGDGIDDILIGAYAASPNGLSRAGESYVVFGRAQNFPAVFPLRSLFPAAGGDGTTGFIVKGIDADDRSGQFLNGAGDVNGDGIDDVIIGAWSADPQGGNFAGESYVIFGRTEGFAANLELRSLLPANGGDGSVGFVLEGVRPGDTAGKAVNGVGDIDGDGIADLLIGADDADPGGRIGAGISYLIFGRQE